MRIIAGEAKGMRLESVPGRDVRPTSDRARESLFNILGPRMAGARFLDLFAGTGANGIEALSRGAARTVFVEQDTRVVRVIEANLAHTRLGDRARVLRATLPAALSVLGRSEEGFDVVFADPPYAWEDFGTLLEGLCAEQLVAHGAVVVVEHSVRAKLPEEAAFLRCFRTCRYGTTGLSLFS